MHRENRFLQQVIPNVVIPHCNHLIIFALNSTVLLKLVVQCFFFSQPRGSRSGSDLVTEVASPEFSIAVV